MKDVTVFVIEKSKNNIAPSYEEVLELLALDPASEDATALRGVANDFQRKKTGNVAAIWGQIGIDVYPCEVDCEFCSFGKSHTSFTGHTRMGIDEILQRAHDFTKAGDLYGLYLMTMNTFDVDYMVDVISALRASIPPQTMLFSNIGDCDQETFERFKKAGLAGAYHTCRIGEGVYTKADPELRYQTIRAAAAAGLRMRACCEPVGAETTDKEIADKLFEIKKTTVELGFTDGVAVMKRTSVAGTIFEGLQTEITDIRLAMLNAIQVLVMIDVPECKIIAFHEPNYLSLVSGGNSMTAETGANPRDTAADTKGHRGLDVADARMMFYQAGFSKLLLADGSTRDLTIDYIRACQDTCD